MACAGACATEAGGEGMGAVGCMTTGPPMDTANGNKLRVPVNG